MNCEKCGKSCGRDEVVAIWLRRTVVIPFVGAVSADEVCMLRFVLVGVLFTSSCEVVDFLQGGRSLARKGIKSRGTGRINLELAAPTYPPVDRVHTRPARGQD